MPSTTARNCRHTRRAWPRISKQWIRTSRPQADRTAMPFLAVDVGNTRLKWALYEQPQPGAAMIAHGAEFLENIDKLAEGAWSTLPAPDRMLGCAVAAAAVKR